MAPSKAPLVPPRLRDINRLFDRFLDRQFADFDHPALETRWTPALDFSETDKEYRIRVEVPDIPKENLDVTMDGNVVTISGHREVHEEKKTEKYIVREREEGKYVRSVRLPTPVRGDRITAHCHNGVLTVFLPKKVPAGKSKILIK